MLTSQDGPAQRQAATTAQACSKAHSLLITHRDGGRRHQPPPCDMPRHPSPTPLMRNGSGLFPHARDSRGEDASCLMLCLPSTATALATAGLPRPQHMAVTSRQLAQRVTVEALCPRSAHVIAYILQDKQCLSVFCRPCKVQHSNCQERSFQRYESSLKIDPICRCTCASITCHT